MHAPMVADVAMRAARQIVPRASSPSPVRRRRRAARAPRFVRSSRRTPHGGRRRRSRACAAAGATKPRHPAPRVSRRRERDRRTAGGEPVALCHLARRRMARRAPSRADLARLTSRQRPRVASPPPRAQRPSSRRRRARSPESRATLRASGRHRRRSRLPPSSRARALARRRRAPPSPRVAVSPPAAHVGVGVARRPGRSTLYRARDRPAERARRGRGGAPAVARGSRPARAASPAKRPSRSRTRVAGASDTCARVATTSPPRSRRRARPLGARLSACAPGLLDARARRGRSAPAARVASSRCATRRARARVRNSDIGASTSGSSARRARARRARANHARARASAGDARPARRGDGRSAHRPVRRSACAAKRRAPSQLPRAERAPMFGRGPRSARARAVRRVAAARARRRRRGERGASRRGATGSDARRRRAPRAPRAAWRAATARRPPPADARRLAARADAPTAFDARRLREIAGRRARGAAARGGRARPPRGARCDVRAAARRPRPVASVARGGHPAARRRRDRISRRARATRRLAIVTAPLRRPRDRFVESPRRAPQLPRGRPALRPRSRFRPDRCGGRHVARFARRPAAPRRQLAAPFERSSPICGTGRRSRRRAAPRRRRTGPRCSASRRGHRRPAGGRSSARRWTATVPARWSPATPPRWSQASKRARANRSSGRPARVRIDGGVLGCGVLSPRGALAGHSAGAPFARVPTALTAAGLASARRRCRRSRARRCTPRDHAADAAATKAVAGWRASATNRLASHGRREFRGDRRLNDINARSLRAVGRPIHRRGARSRLARGRGRMGGAMPAAAVAPLPSRPAAPRRWRRAVTRARSSASWPRPDPDCLGLMAGARRRHAAPHGAGRASVRRRAVIAA